MYDFAPPRTINEHMIQYNWSQMLANALEIHENASSPLFKSMISHNLQLSINIRYNTIGTGRMQRHWQFTAIQENALKLLFFAISDDRISTPLTGNG